MNSEEYTNLAHVEQDHWYYSGKRAFVKDWIKKLSAPTHNMTLLDCGAGTGIFAKEMTALCNVLVLDDHEEALRLLETRFSKENIIKLTEPKIPLPDNSLDYVTALDVLEHIPVDTPVVQDFYRLLKPKGLAVITVPASMLLWSDWDVSLQHYRRYSRQSLTKLFPASQWDILTINYTNTFAFLPVLLVRKWRKLKTYLGFKSTAARSEDRLPPSWLNRLLRFIFIRTALLPIPMPFGVSLLLIAQRKP